MTSFLFLTEAIYCNIFRYKYLRKEKYFLLFFFLHFLKLDWNLKILKKKMTLIVDVFLNLRTRKNVVRSKKVRSKKSRLRGHLNK